MELHSSSRLMRGLTPLAICNDYLDRLPIDAKLRLKLFQKLENSSASNAADLMENLHLALAAELRLEDENPAYQSISRRLSLFNETWDDESKLPIQGGGKTIPHITTGPVINRLQMAPSLWTYNFKPSWLQFLKKYLLFSKPDTGELFNTNEKSTGRQNASRRWQQAAINRRSVLLLLVLAQTSIATYFMNTVLPYHGQQPLEMVILALFAILCGWVSAGFWTAVMGFLILRSGQDGYAISRSNADHAPLSDETRTAIIMPICNEHIPRVFAGLKATYDSLKETNELDHFDFFVLSDSGSADTCVAETEAWLDICQETQGFDRIFYRWRQHRIKRKSGNVGDFCRRWGSNYRYMIILDADSVMNGNCITKLVRLMESNPDTGIIQTAPHTSGRDTLYARIQQFSNCVYGPVFIAGLHYWQLGESHYWGHNAIIRIQPFMQYCALGRLPGTGSLSGEILSHDFVEAALMRRAGWAVWIAYDLSGSFEEMPPNLIDELKRDRRWCYGNLMNFRLFLTPGLHSAHRAAFLTGVIAYLSAPLWLMFLLISTLLLARHTLLEPQYFTQPKQLFPVWPEWHPVRAIALFLITTTWLFMPKILSVFLIIKQGAQHFGGSVRLIFSMFLEWIFSMLMAPIRMLFHSQFVVAALSGWTLEWQSPPREDADTLWNEAVRSHRWHTFLGLIWAAIVYWVKPAYLIWMLPIVGALIFSIPISYYSSLTNIGRGLRKAGLFLIPEESKPPSELKQLYASMKHLKKLHAFVDTVIDPIMNAIACALPKSRSNQPESIRKHHLRLVNIALRDGSEALSDPEKLLLLNNPYALSILHFQVWSSPEAHASWFQT